MTPLVIVAGFNPDQARNLSGESGGQWTAQPPTSAEKADAANDQAAKDEFLKLLGMNEQQQAAYLKTLKPGMLQRLGTFAYLGSGDKEITAIRAAISKEVTNRGGDPVSIGAPPKKAAGGKGKSGAKKAAATGGKGGGGAGKKPAAAKAPSGSPKQPAAKKTKPKVTVGKQPAPGPAVKPPAATPAIQVPMKQQDLATGRTVSAAPVITTTRRDR